MMQMLDTGHHARRVSETDGERRFRLVSSAKADQYLYPAPLTELVCGHKICTASPPPCRKSGEEPDCPMCAAAFASAYVPTSPWPHSGNMPYGAITPVVPGANPPRRM